MTSEEKSTATQELRALSDVTLAPQIPWPIEDPAAFRGDPDATRAKFRDARDEGSRRLDQRIAEHRANEPRPAAQGR